MSSTQRGRRDYGPAVLLVVACLAAISICPLGIGEGSFPAAAYHIRIQDSDGAPLSAALMSVRLKGENEEALGYPFDNYTSPNTLLSDTEGKITVQHLARGFEFGGQVTILSMLLGGNAPVYVCTITASGHKPVQFTTDQLFKRAYAGEPPDGQTSITVDGEQLGLDVYDYVVTVGDG